MEDQFLTPLKQIKRAKPSTSLYGRIEEEVFNHKIVPLKTLTLVAASILLLLFVNIYAVNQTSLLDSKNSDIEYADQIINAFEIY